MNAISLQGKSPQFLLRRGDLIAKQIISGNISCNLFSCANPLKGKKNLVLIHGLGNAWSFWMNNIADFSELFNVYIYDMPWNCNQPCPFETFEQVSDWVFEVFKKANIMEPILLAHSYGAAVALSMALKANSAFFSKQILCSILWMPEDLVEQRIQRLKAFLPKYKDFVYAGVLASVRPNTQSDIVLRIYEKALEVMDHKTVIQYLNLLCERGESFFYRVDTPTLFITGAADDIVPIGDSVWLSKQLRNSWHFSIPESKHFPMVEAKEDFHETVQKFCSGQAFA